MSDTNFVDKQTVIVADWLNDVNDFVYQGKVPTGNTISISVDSISALKALDKNKFTHAEVYGYYTKGDGGGGLYWYDSSDVTSVDNGGSIIIANDGARWKLSTPAGNVTLSPRVFGLKLDGTDETTAFKNLVKYIHDITTDAGTQGTILFPRGTLGLSSPVDFGKNINIKSFDGGTNFSVVFKPLATFSGSYLFSINGDLCIGGFAFRQQWENFMVDCSLVNKTQLPKLFYINKAYTIKLKDFWLYNTVGTAIEIGAANDIILDSPHIYGQSADVTSAEYGIRILSAGTGGGGGGVTIISPDIEVCFKGVSQETTARVNLVAPYMERNIIGWQAIGTSNGHLTVEGGEVESPGASGTAASITGANCTVIGGTYKANSGVGLVISASARPENCNLIGVNGDVTDLRNYARKEIGGTTRWYRSVARSQKDPADNVATGLFTVTVPFASSYFGVVDVELNARDQAGYTLHTARYRFAVSNVDGTLRSTAVTEYGKATLAASGNYSMAVTCTVSISGTTATFNVTADTGGALGAGLASRVSAEATLVQWDSTGPVYLTAL